MKWTKGILFSLISWIMVGCASPSEGEKECRVYPNVEADSVLRVTTLSRSTSYFTLRDGHEMGFEYEICKSMADDMGKKLEVMVAKDMDELVAMLDSGCAMIAFPLSISNNYKQLVDFADHEFISHQVIVQRKSTADRPAKKDVLDLIGHKITVVAGSKYHHRLLHLNDEIGGGLEIRTVPTDFDEEQLIKMVAQDEIEMTAADIDVANLSRMYYHNIDTRLEISHPQRGAWATAKGDTTTLGIINRYFHSNEKKIEKLHKKYFEASAPKRPNKIPTYIDDHTICPFDSLFRMATDSTTWDWRFIAAISYIESRFNPSAGSFAGAKGIMQLMPETMLSLGADPSTMLEPKENIQLAVTYLTRMRDVILSYKTQRDRLAFILAAYNAGLGHLRDAQRLCELHGGNPAEWRSVATYIKKLASPEYFNMPGIRCGYLRGEETVDYVRSIMELYDTYKREIKR